MSVLSHRGGISALIAGSLVFACPPVEAADARRETIVEKTYNQSPVASRLSFDYASECLQLNAAGRGLASHFTGFGDVADFTLWHGLSCRMNRSADGLSFVATVESGAPALYPEQNREPGKIYMHLRGARTDRAGGGYTMTLSGGWRTRALDETSALTGTIEQSFSIADTTDPQPGDIRTQDTLTVCRDGGDCFDAAAALSADDKIEAEKNTELFAYVKYSAMRLMLPVRPRTVAEAVRLLPPEDIDRCFDRFFFLEGVGVVGAGVFKDMLYATYNNVSCTGNVLPQDKGVQINLMASTDEAFKSSAPAPGSLIFTAFAIAKPDAASKGIAVESRGLADMSFEGGPDVRGILRASRVLFTPGNKAAQFTADRQTYIRHPLLSANAAESIPINLAEVSDQEASAHARASDWLDTLMGTTLRRAAHAAQPK